MMTDTLTSHQPLTHLAAAIEHTQEAVYVTDRDGIIVLVNRAFTRLTGYQLEEAVGRTTRILRSGLHPEAHFRSMWRTLLAGETWRGEMINRKKYGGLYTHDLMISPLGSDYFVATSRPS